MRYHLQCKCTATCWATGDYEHDTNATVIDEYQKLDWDGGEPECAHEEFEIIDAD